MQDACIDLESLKKVDRLGEGAFATVDKCIYQTQVGFKREVAVKRLKPNVRHLFLPLVSHALM